MAKRHGWSEHEVAERASGDRQNSEGERISVAFTRALREASLKVPISSTLSFARALDQVGVDSRLAPYWAGRATLIHRPEDIPVYDRVFAAFWQQRYGEWVNVDGQENNTQTLALDTDDEGGADDQDDDDDQDDNEDLQAVRFSRVEILTDKDIGECSEDELAELSQLMTRLRFTTKRRRSRRRVSASRATDQPDLRRTVRRALRYQGETVDRRFRSKRLTPRRLVFVLDVSGSMESYARGFLRFAHAAVVARQRVEVFALGTRLTRVTRQLNNRDPDAALASATPEVKDWSGGTRLGDVFRQFNDQWAIRGMARGAVVVILSDGWDRGEADILGEQMERLHRVTHELVWVNPLKATPGYAPIAAGMAAALPHVDTFVSGHSYRSLSDLADILSGASSPT